MIERKLHRKLLCLLGLALLCAMLRPPFFSSLITANIPNAHELRSLYDALIIACGVLLFAVYTHRRGGASLSPSSFASLGLLAFAGSATLDIGHLLLGNSLPVAVVGTTLVALGLCALTVGWIAHVARFERSLVLPIFVAAFVVSHVFGIFDMLPRGIEALVVPFYPLCSSLLLLLSRKHESEDATVLAPGEEDSRRYFKRLQWLALTLIVVEILCGALLRTSYTHGGVGYSPSSLTLITYAESAIIGIAAYLIVRRRKYASENALIVGGLCLLPLLLAAIGLVVLPQSSLVPFITGTFSMLLVMLMGLATLWYQDSAMPAEACAGAVIALYGLAIDITFTILPRILGISGIASQEQILYAAALGGVVIAFGVSFCLLVMVFLQRRDFIQATDTILVTEPAGLETSSPLTPYESSTSSFDLAIDKIAEKHHLTKRETEIALLIARGYTAKRIAEDLVVSTGTIQSHSKNIYKKMGIHRKDELIKLVEDIRSQL